MIQPIGFEPEGKPRLPWVTFALVLALLAGFVAARGELLFTGGAGDVKLENAVEVWLTRPYLVPDPRLLAQIENGDSGAEYAGRIASARDSAAAPPGLDAAKRAQQQAELDYVTRIALRGSDAAPGTTHPFRLLGWVPHSPRVTALFAHPFLHAGFGHLLLAVLLIWLAAPALERAYGSLLLVGLCLASALAAAGVYSLAAIDTATPLVGAWGMAGGLVAAFVVRFGDDEARLGAESLVVPAWFVLPAWALASLAMYLLFGTAAVETGESFAPNLAGFGCGGVGALVIQALRVEDRRAMRARLAREELPQIDPRVRKAMDAHARGSHDQAISLATGVLRERPDDADALAVIWNAHLASGRESQGAATAKRLIEVYARHGQLAPAARVWDELAGSVSESRLETTVLLRIVPELIVQARRDAAISALRCVVAPENRSLSVGQAVRATELALELDPKCALTAARFALTHASELADDKRERLTKLAAELEAKLGAAAVGIVLPPPPPELESHASLESQAPLPAPSPAADADSFARESASQAETIPTIVIAPVSPATAAPPAPGRSEPSAVKVTPAVPVELDPAGVRLRVDGAAPSLLAWERIHAVGVGLVAGIAPKPIVVIDLALNWADCGDGVLEVLRMRSDSFRARSLVGGEGSALEALRALLAQLLARSGGVPLPDGGSAHGLPFREFSDPSSYERDVLLQAG